MDFSRDIEDFDLVFLDIETTGLDVVEGDTICEIGALKVRQRKIIDTFQSLINPGRSVPRESYLIHKISDEDLKFAPHFKDVAAGFLNFISDAVICAYNADFDIGFINNHLRKINYSEIESCVIDILSMARKTVKLPKYNLRYIANFFTIDYKNGLHRALLDSGVTSQVFFKLTDILKEKRLNVLEQYVSIFGMTNSITKSKEEAKARILREAIESNNSLKIRYFSYHNIMQEEAIIPINLFSENKALYLWCKDVKAQELRINLDRIFEIQSA